MKIIKVETIHFSLPVAQTRVSLGTAPKPARVEVLAVRVMTSVDHVGLGFTTVPVAGRVVRSLIESELAPILIGEDANDNQRLFARAQNRFAGAGWRGLASRAYAAIDIALWDLKAKAAELPLYRLLGGARSFAPCFAGDLANLGTDPQQTIHAARPLVEQGMLGVSVEVGVGDVQLDADRVQQIRDGLGESAWLGISAGGRYDFGTALAMAHFYEEDVGIDWFDTPIPVEDRNGYRRLAERMEVPLAIGSSFDDRDQFLRVLERGDVRVIRPDPLRLGGVTPLLKVAALADAYQVAVVPYCLPEIGVHLACGLPNVPFAEWGSWLAGIFVDPVVPLDGKMNPRPVPGIGVELNPEATVKFQVD
jgi:L-alanine-DL-glutamate epimerase-like enolase superfamily enzyme